MRKFVLCLFALMSVSWVNGFAQVPQWKVIKEFSISNSNTPVPATLLFTPEVQGVYRVNAYLGVTTSISENTTWAEHVNWTDLTGVQGGVTLEITLNSGSNYQSVTQVFSPKVGTQVTFVMESSLPPPTDATYTTAVAIEKLMKSRTTPLGAFDER